MASFVPDLNITNDPSYLGLSKEPDKQQGDRSFEALFSGLGDMLGEGAQAFDRSIQQNISDRARQEIEPIRDAGLSLDETKAVAGTGARGKAFEAGLDADLGEAKPGLPGGAKSQLSNLEKLKEAYANGQRSDSYYYTQLNAVVSKLRAEFPGYTDQIDSAVEKITGVVPANALRKSLLSDLNAQERANSSATQKAWTEYHQDNGYIQQIAPGLTPEQYIHGGKRSEIQVEVGKLKAKDLRMKTQEAELDLEVKRGNVDSKRAEDVFTEFASRPPTQYVTTTLNALDTKFKEIQKQGANADPKALQELSLQTQDHLNEMRRALWSKANERRSVGDKGELGKSYVQLMGEKRVGEIIEAQLSPIKSIAEMVSVKNGDGYAMAAGNIIKHQDDQAMLRLKKLMPNIDLVDAIRKKTGNEGFAVVMRDGGSKMVSDIAETYRKGSVAGVADSKPGEAPAFNEIIDSTPSGKKGTQTKALLDSFHQMTKNEDPKVAAQFVESLFKSDKFFAELSEEDKAAVYTKLGEPGMYEKIKAMGGETAQMYSTWMEKNFVPVGKLAVDTLQKDMVEFNRFDTQFNKEGFNFFATPKPGYETDTRPSLFGQADPIRYSAEKLGPINRFLKQVQPVLEDKYGKEGAAVKAMELLGKGGYDPSKPKQGNMIEQLGDAVFKAFGAEAPNRTPAAAPVETPKAPNLPKSGSVGDKPKYSLVDQTVTDIANNFVGLHEQTDRSTIATFIQKATGKNVDPAKTPWCAAFANAVLKTAGETGTDSLAARDFLNVGKEISKPTEGDIVVLSRGRDTTKGHVGFVQGFVNHGGEKYVKVLGGNQNDRVSVQEYPASRVLGYRRVSAVEAQKYAEAEGLDPFQEAAA